MEVEEGYEAYFGFVLSILSILFQFYIVFHVPAAALRALAGYFLVLLKIF